MERPLLTREQCREVDRRAICELGIPGIVLMENAGRGVAEFLLNCAANNVAILCGKGNNAGDGFVIARHLAVHGVVPSVILLADPSQLTGDALTNYTILLKSGTRIVDLSGGANLESALDSLNTDAQWLVDAMLGTGAVGDPREPYRSAIDWMNRQNSQRLAVDIPSGLDCDTGQPAVHTIRADHTCTFAAMKVGFTKPAAKDFTGTIHVCDIGVPPRLVENMIHHLPHKSARGQK